MSNAEGIPNVQITNNPGCYLSTPLAAVWRAWRLTVTLLLCVVTLRVQADTLIVTNTNDSGAGSLRQAIADANDGDTIAFAVSGAIGLTSGELLVDKDLTISGPGAENLAVDGNTKSRVFHIISETIENQTTVTISGLAIRNGVASGGDYPDDSGAGIYNDHATLTLNDCAITGNVASGYGGGIFNDSDNGDIKNSRPAFLTINNSMFTGNSAGSIGGGVYNYAVVSNTASLTVNNSTFTANSAGDSGGGIGNFSADYVDFATVFLNNCTLSGNSAVVDGGGISNFAGAGGYATLEVNNNTLTNNSSQYGGGMSNTVALFGYALIDLSNSTVSGNSAQAGGGVHNEGGEDSAGTELHIRNSTLAGNSATDAGGGIYNYQSNREPGPLDLVNTILDAGDSGENIYNDGYGITISLGYNLSSDDGSGYLTGPGDQINTDPLLGPLQNNGGPTLTHELLPDSPAINAGDPNFTPPPLYDQRGPGFERVVGGRVDIGSFEVEEPTPTPTATATVTPTVTPTPTPPVTPTPTPTPTVTPTATPTPTPTPTATPRHRPTPRPHPTPAPRPRPTPHTSPAGLINGSNL
jgi:hypothetical protein